MNRHLTERTWIRSSFENLAAILVAAILFAASFPNIIFTNGLPLLAWIAYIPVFWVMSRVGLFASVFWGAIYGYAAYGLFNYWLSVFHPLAGLIVGSIYMFYMAMLFPLLRLAIYLFPRKAYILQFLLWMAYEYLRTLGFLGYSYGITGYSQWNILPIVQIASVTGVWGVSALVVFPSAWLAAALNDYSPKSGLLGLRSCLFTFFQKERLSAIVWFVLLAASLIYGFGSRIDYSEAPTFKAALIQHNTDPWLPTHSTNPLEEYRRDFHILRDLSNEALAAHPDTDLVVWSETAFVPRIWWHSNIRDSQVYWQLVRELLEYLEGQEVPFITGNDDGRRDPVLNPNSRENHQVNYNAAILFERGKITEVYRKLHLVPFTEHFPFEKQFPRIHQALINADTHFWIQGTEPTVFILNDIKFSTPICFEDTFGYLGRKFVQNGAELFVNLSNDAWSQSLSAQMQHLGMAVFRSVENRRSMLRSTSSGQTSAIDPNGRVIAMAEPFAETWLVAEVPIVTTTTIYTRFGDILGKAFACLAIIMLLFGLASYIIRSRK